MSNTSDGTPRYEYEYERISGGQIQRGPGYIDEKAERGYRFVGHLGVKGSTTILIFERPIGDCHE